MTQNENGQGKDPSLADRSCEIQAVPASPATTYGAEPPSFCAPGIDCVAYICPPAANSSTNYKMCHAFAAANGFKITETYFDQHIGRRPQLERLMLNAKLRHFNQVLISDIFRLVGPGLRTFDVVECLLSCGVTVHCGNRGSLISLRATDLADATGKAAQVSFFVNLVRRSDPPPGGRRKNRTGHNLLLRKTLEPNDEQHQS